MYMVGVFGGLIWSASVLLWLSSPGFQVERDFALSCVALYVRSAELPW